MFNDKYCLTLSVLNGTKTMTRRVLRDNIPLGNWEETIKHLPYKVGEVVAIAQSYNDIGKPQYDKFGKGVAGNSNKMFVKAELMPHHIRITDVKVEYLQNISDDDIMREGIYHQRFFNKVEYVFATKGKMNNTPVHWQELFPTPREAFATLIDKISGKGTWESNPFVLAYSFELID